MQTKAQAAETAARQAAAGMMMTVNALLSSMRRLAKAQAGVAAVEFAFIAPIMIVLFFGVVEGSSAYSANRKVMQSANMLADLVAQESSVTQGNLDDLFVGMEDIISSRDIDVDFTVASVYLDTATNEVKVHWSRNSKGETPYPAKSVYAGPVDPALLDDTSYLVVAETEYDYASPISQKVIGDVAMRKFASRWPRQSSKVQYCVSPGNCTS